MSARKPKRGVRFALSVAMSLGILGAFAATVAAASDFENKAAAAAAGDPSASAPLMVTPLIFTYEGERISEAQADEEDLACLQTAESFICADEMPEPAAVAEKSMSPKATASAACPGGAVVLQTYQHLQYTGLETGLATVKQWVDQPPSMNNETTSFRMGERAGHLSDFTNGNGFWYPGDTSVCAYRSNIVQFDPGWNDRITSRYRIP
jgi:hypothetical protein